MHGDKDSGAIWLFLWLLDKMTIINHEIGEGKVLGGKPIKFEEIKDHLPIHRITYQRWLKILREGGYIQTTRTPYGLVIIVNKAFKVFGQKTKEKRDDTGKLHLSENGENRLQADPATSLHARPATSNKTIQRQDSNKKKSIKEKRFSTLEEITPEVVEEVANQYRVPVSFVEIQLDKMRNWLEAKGKRYKNYKAGLRNWVVNDPNYSKSKIQISKPMPEYIMTPKEREDGRKQIEKIRKEKFGESQTA